MIPLKPSCHLSCELMKCFFNDSWSTSTGQLLSKKTTSRIFLHPIRCSTCMLELDNSNNLQKQNWKKKGKKHQTTSHSNQFDTFSLPKTPHLDAGITKPTIHPMAPDSDTQHLIVHISLGHLPDKNRSKKYCQTTHWEESFLRNGFIVKRKNTKNGDTVYDLDFEIWPIVWDDIL